MMPMIILKRFSVALILFLAVSVLILSSTGTRIVLSFQGKGGEVVAKPAPTPKKTAPKRNTSARSTNSTKSNPGGKPSDTTTVAAELLFWNSIKDSTNPDDFSEYLKKYPQGQFAGLATNRLNTLKPKPSSTPQTTGSTSNAVSPVIRPCIPPPSDMENWYAAEENANDSLGAGNGRLENGARFGPGKVGRAFNFNGVDQYVSVPSYKPTAPLWFTIAAWVNFSRLERGAIVVSRYDGRWHGWLLQSLENGNFQFQVLKEPEVQKAASGSIGPIAPNTWVHVAGTYDGSTITLYINGSVAGTANFAVGYSPSAIAMTIGKASWYEGNFLAGSVDEVQFFNRALSASEIRSIFNAGEVGNCHSESR
jgi:hypothetical protein